MEFEAHTPPGTPPDDAVVEIDDDVASINAFMTHLGVITRGDTNCEQEPTPHDTDPGLCAIGVAVAEVY